MYIFQVIYVLVVLDVGGNQEIIFMNYDAKKPVAMGTVANDYLRLIRDLTKDPKTLLIVFPEIPLKAEATEDEMAAFSANISLGKTPCWDYSEMYLQDLSCAARDVKTLVAMSMLDIEEEPGELIPTDFIFQINGEIALRFYNRSVYQMIGQALNVTIIFSGLNNPKEGLGGAGIYHASGGQLFMEYLPAGGTKTYTYKYSLTNVSGIENAESVEPEENLIDIDAIGKAMDGFRMRVDPDLERFKSEVLDTSNTRIQKEVCYEEDHTLCCQFDIKLSTSETHRDKTYTYHMVSFKNYKNYFNVFDSGGVEICAVIACLNSEISSCGQRFPNYIEINWPVTFQELSIKANFGPPDDEMNYPSTQFPNSVLSSMKPIPPEDTKWEEKVYSDGEIREKSFSLVKQQNRLLTFAIFGRNFTIKIDRSGGEEIPKSSFLIFLLLSFMFVFWSL